LERIVTSVSNLLSVNSPTPQQLADALVSTKTKSGLTAVTFAGNVIQGEVFTTPLQGFPTDGDSFVVLSNGVASTTPGIATTTESQSVGGETIPAGDPMGSPDGLISFDAVTVSLTFSLPEKPGRLSFDWKFGTEEIPSFQNTFKDYFRADIITGSGHTNIALLPNDNPVTTFNMQPFSNRPGGGSSDPTPPYPTPDDVTFNSVTTNITRSFFDLTPYGGQEVTLAFRVADVLDSTLNTGALIDNVRIEGLERSIDRNDVKNLLLSSIGFEELGLAHLINAEAEKIQYVLGTIEGQRRLDPPPTIEEILAVNCSVNQSLGTMIKKEMILQFKLEETEEIIIRPAIDVSKLVSVDNGQTWVDADTPPGPTLIGPTIPRFEFIVTNTGNVTLTEVTLFDTELGVITSGGILSPGDSFELIRTGTFALGQQVNTATASGSFNGQIVTDSDSAFYFGIMEG